MFLLTFKLFLQCSLLDLLFIGYSQSSFFFTFFHKIMLIMFEIPNATGLESLRKQCMETNGEVSKIQHRSTQFNSLLF